MDFIEQTVRELAAQALEHVAKEAAHRLRNPYEERMPAALAAFPTEEPITSYAGIRPEVGDDHSSLLRDQAIRDGILTPRDGIIHQNGWTEEEYERRG